MGAGLSGIDAAYRLRREHPDLRIAILEARDRIGGTWDLFRYPGIRSDSDMETLGFPFRPWRGDKSIADGGDIRAYIDDTAKYFGIDALIQFGCRAERADWSSREAAWQVTVAAKGRRKTITTRLLYLAAGYYDFDQGYMPDIPHADAYGGRIVQPQFWPENLNYDGKSVVIVGSGATAITLAPSMARTASHVTMLQRSPTYIVSRPGRDRMSRRLRGLLPPRLADWAIKWKNVLGGIFTYRLARRRPERVRAYILSQIQKALGPGYDVQSHFAPQYKPWDQRICVAPDGDLFAAIRRGKVSMVTDHITRFTPTGLKLASGITLNADIVVMATGLKLQMLGGLELRLDGAPISAAGRLIYKGMMLDGVPNLAFAFGYTNASWTLKSDLTARYFCRLLRVMAAQKAEICMPLADETARAQSAAMVPLQAGYVSRASNILPRQGAEAPWRLNQNYVLDRLDLDFGSVDDGVMRFSGRAADLADARRFLETLAKASR